MNAAPVPPGSLSSNWKILQKRLAASHASPGPGQLPAAKKRKTSAAAEEKGKERREKKEKRRRGKGQVDDDETSTKKRSRRDHEQAKESTPPKKRRKHHAREPSMSPTPSVSEPAEALTPRARKKKAASTPTPSSKAGTGAIATTTKSASAISASLALWAEDNDISAADLARAYDVSMTATSLPPSKKAGKAEEADGEGAGEEVLQESKKEVGKYVAMDCEMVGVGGPYNERSALARVSIVNFHGYCVLDCFVKPKEKVTDWRTWVSGVSPANMRDALTFEEAQKKVADILTDRVLVGHAIRNDLQALLLSHPARDIRDTSRHAPFRKRSGGKTPGLKKLAKEILGIEIQGGSHSSIEDARACMLLYRRHKDEFEQLHAKMFPHRKNKDGGGSKMKKKKKN